MIHMIETKGRCKFNELQLAPGWDFGCSPKFWLETHYMCIKLYIDLDHITCRFSHSAQFHFSTSNQAFTLFSVSLSCSLACTLFQFFFLVDRLLSLYLTWLSTHMLPSLNSQTHCFFTGFGSGIAPIEYEKVNAQRLVGLYI